jgi:hypothetical protein
MHLHQLCGPWMHHPFWRTKFIVSDPKDIAAILASGVPECVIDVSKGLDVAEDRREHQRSSPPDGLGSQAQQGFASPEPWSAEADSAASRVRCAGLRPPLTHPNPPTQISGEPEKSSRATKLREELLGGSGSAWLNRTSGP